MVKALPNKPSDLAELALRDMRRVIRSPRYHIEMGFWHEPNKTCAVCAAGAVMAFTLNVPCRAYADPSFFPRDTDHKLDAIDDLRRGHVGRAFRGLGRSYHKGMIFNRGMARYKERNRKPFFRDMRRLIKDLRAAGY